ncbi:type VI secretion system protein TssA [Citrobacter amalonaticus]|uniref:Type VI secretion system protein TssA n=1 Tax=Citrobacter amalonaticus TaxID=35703 RepID=A0A2S4RXP3_CITAM|nr:type VI secretion system ImpA family N-terminal domain-containing protein [Citrobacter amalonaticus]POT56144.1 type VI secretion system protein TssA [Citrobacter amalonaticus]POT74453.1 type VI secretion system protein TssA [Citrobacter amalonaticus]POU65252.1 type VI secretion system protein TssA [Citrobacter amalonaticus]POV04087.1 type VI secretion system protein TssA [Citrobacter amalonaticus]
MENIQALLAPIRADNLCGDAIRYSPEFDRLAAARQQDDETLPTGVWQSTPRRADWEEVASIATLLTETLSKDLVIMGWLGEAWIRTRGLSALPDALALSTLALERYPVELHPQIKEGDYDYRAAPLRWMAQQYATLIAGAPLFTVHGETISLTQWQQGKLTDIPLPGAEVPHAQALTASLEWLKRLNAICQSWPDASAPSFSVMEQKIKTCLQALGNVMPEAPQPVVQDAAPAIGNTVTFAHREQAYLVIKQVADYLARTEPHSPVPYLLYRACAWGNMPLPELLSELINGDESARRLWRQLGVLP